MQRDRWCSDMGSCAPKKQKKTSKFRFPQLKLLICKLKKTIKMTFKKISLFAYIALLLISSCAKRGTISGGAKDTIAPILTRSMPKNYATNFDGKQFKLYFDEYVKLKDVNKQLVISPPMNTAPEILPNGVSKEITVKIKDTLRPNTTYNFNFGQSIQDNNEGNPYSQFKYVFSTGNAIDSLSISGNIKDALEKKPSNFVSVMLYEVDEKYTDSVIFKQKPRYVTNTLDSLKTFKIENIKAGKYMLVAIKDNNNNFKFDPKTEKIGFEATPIEVPTDKVFELKMFKETPVFKAFKPTQASANRVIVGFEGDAKDLKITLKNGDAVLKSIVTKIPKADSLQIWFQKIKTDSLQMTLASNQFVKNFSFKMKDQKRDTLSVSPSKANVLEMREDFFVKASTPLILIDNFKISLTNSEGNPVDFSTKYNEMEQKLEFAFKKETTQKYICKLLPGAVTDFFEKQNDSLTFKFSTRAAEEYGNLKIKLVNARNFPMIVELTNEKGDVLASEYTENSTDILFNYLDPAVFFVRIIEDQNQNHQWDPGNYMQKKQSENVIYFSKKIDVRANWDVEQPVDLEK